MDYTWTSGPTKKQVKVPAPEYTDYVLTVRLRHLSGPSHLSMLTRFAHSGNFKWAEKLIGDESMFPTKSGRDFSPAFPKTAVHLYTQFLRIFAHLYHAHFRDILHLSLEAHLNVRGLLRHLALLWLILFVFMSAELVRPVLDVRPHLRVAGSERVQSTA